MSIPKLVTASTGPSLVLAAPGQPAVDTEARTISGLIVPFGKAGQTSGGRLRFKAGSLTWSDVRRVKLLREHDQRDVLGYATELTERTDGPQGPGVYATFHVPEGDNGDRALAEAQNGLRDAFSVGVQLDDATLQRLRRAQVGATVDAAGALRETSQVSVPAFDDARVAAAAGADLVVSAWTATTPDTSAAGAGTTHQEGTIPMNEKQRRRLAQLLAQASRTDAENTELGQLTGLATAAGVTITGATITGDLETDAGDAAAETDEADAAAGGTAQAGAHTIIVNAAGPAVVPAVAGAAVVTSEPSTYDFSGGHSLVRDLFDGAQRRNAEAQERVERFNAELREGNEASVAALATAAATRGDVDGVGTDLPNVWQPNGNRPDLMRALVDVKRPIVSRLSRVPITNAQPFSIPKVGEFSGVGPHAEGTPHRPAGTLSLSGDTVTPTATSGAWEVSRELLDAATPALDRIAVRAMLRDYQRQTEGKVISLFDVLAADPTAHRYGVNRALALRSAMLNFVNDDDEPGDLFVLSKGLLGIIAEDIDAMDRAQLPFVGHSNALGSVSAGYTGLTIDGHELVRSARLDAGIADANVAGSVGVLARAEGILWAESSVQQFRFDEVLGPGVIKLALWAYSGAAILDTDDVQIINSGADPTP